MTTTWWIATIIFLLGFALVVSGIWIKAGPELAMIMAGGFLVWFASIGFKIEE